ncbi:MAG TPA: hypothetical protein VIF10_08965 [Methylobacter sp.]|jgi:hypothetical protein
MISDIQQQLEEIKNNWDSISNAVLPDDLTPLGFPGLSKVEISDTFGGLAKIIEHLSRAKDYEPTVVSVNNLRQQLKPLLLYVTTHIPSGPIPHMPELLRLLSQVDTIVRTWFEESDRKSRRAVTGLAMMQAEALSRIDDAAKIYEELKRCHQEVLDFSSNAKTEAESLTNLLNNVTNSQIAAETAATESAASVVLAQNYAKEINTLLSGFVSLKDELEISQNTQAKLFEQFEDYRNTINDLLGDANRTGMAASFTKRKRELSGPMRNWLLAFACSILGLVAMGVIYLAPLLEPGKLELLPYRLTLVAPFIWLGWFSAKQYGYTARLREDYAYKEASAMSFEGYRREVIDTDVEMQKNLLDTAIKNLGDNPIRIYNGHENHASPLHEIIEKLLKDKKLMDILKTTMAKDKD